MLEKQRISLLGQTFFLSLFGSLGFRGFSKDKHRNDKMAFAKALISTQERERKRISDNWNTGIAESLLILKNQLQVTQAITQYNTLMLSEGLAEVRSISSNLKPFQIERLGLTRTIEDHLQRTAQSSGIQINKEIENIDHLISEQAPFQILQTIQEALNLVIKSFNSSTIKVSIQEEKHHIIVQILGKGISQEIDVANPLKIGLKTIDACIRALKGGFKIEQNQANRMLILIKLPKKED